MMTDRADHVTSNVLKVVFYKFYLGNFIEIALWHGCSPVNLLHIFRTPFLRTPLDGCFWTEKLPHRSCKDYTGNLGLVDTFS